MNIDDYGNLYRRSVSFIQMNTDLFSKQAGNPQYPLVMKKDDRDKERKYDVIVFLN